MSLFSSKIEELDLHAGGRRATIGTYPSCLALIRPANAAAQLVLRTQAGRKEQRWFLPVSATLLRN
jgi:hypothetical protein